MITVKKIIGKVGDPIFRGKPIDWIDVASFEAAKRVLHCQAASGAEVGFELPRGSYLSDGAVVGEYEDKILAVRRKPEDALVVRFDPTADLQSIVEEAVKIGHAFGNQHLPVEVHDLEIRVPITTSQNVVEQTLEQLGLKLAIVNYYRVRFALDKGFHDGHAHGH